MKPCPECGGPKALRDDPKKPDELTLWETHRDGCSWSPMMPPAEHSWPMRNLPRTDATVPRPGGDPT